jgi:acid phosphatase type 7
MASAFGKSRGFPWLAVPLLVWFACGTDIQSPSAPGTNEVSNEVSALIGAGDIAVCGSPGSIATGRLLDDQQGTIFAVGDLAYPQGSAEDFLNCYGPTWGRHRTRTRPAPGNHEYESMDAAPYFAYFGSSAGPPGLGYYRYRSGGWQVYSWNSNLGAARGIAQTQWLKSELAAQPSLCSMAYFHHPLVSSGPHGLEPTPSAVHDLWMALHDAGAEVVISAHEHFYERLARQTPDSLPDPDYGIRQFVVGTGGAPLMDPVRRVHGSEVVLTKFGILRLTLEPITYKWEFLSADGGAVLDSGSEPCHLSRPKSANP